MAVIAFANALPLSLYVIHPFGIQFTEGYRRHSIGHLAVGYPNNEEYALQAHFDQGLDRIPQRIDEWFSNSY